MDPSPVITAEELRAYAQMMHGYPPGEDFCLGTLNQHIAKSGLRAVDRGERVEFHMEPIT